jgi:hypothetical protein
MAAFTLFQLERELNKRLGPWLDEAEAIRDFCLKSGLAVPSVMLPIFGANIQITPREMAVAAPPAPAIKTKRVQAIRAPRLDIPFQVPAMPNYGAKPQEAGDDWVPIPLESVSVANLLLYLMNSAGRPLSSVELIAGLAKYRKRAGQSTVSMTLKKLKEEEYVSGDSNAWKLTRDVGGVISGDRLWCPLRQLRSTDKAAVRREVIIASLNLNGRLPIYVIVDSLQACTWLTVPADANTVKADLRVMKGFGFVRKIGTEWEVVKRDDSLF